MGVKTEIELSGFGVAPITAITAYSEPPLLTQPKVFKFQWLLHLAMLSYRDAEEDGMGSWA